VDAWFVLERTATVLSREFRCIVMDLPNYGLTGPVVCREPEHDLMARIAVALMDSLNVPRFFIAGSSQGGQVALNIGTHHPGRAMAIVSGGCNVSTGGDAYSMRPFPSEAIRKVAEADAHPADRARLMLAMEALLHDPELIRPDVLDEMHMFRNGAHEWFDALGRSPVVHKDNSAALATYSVPTQLIWGVQDRMVPVEHGFYLLNHVKAVELIIFPQCGHWVPFECPDAYAGHVRRFLLEHVQAA